MSAKEVKTMYDTLLLSGDLLEFYPSLTGVWEKDKKEFENQFYINQRLLNEESEDFDFFGEDEIY